MDETNRRSKQRRTNVIDMEMHRYKKKEERTTRMVLGTTILAFVVLCLGVLYNFVTHTPVPTTSVSLQTGMRPGFHTGLVVREEQAYIMDFFGSVRFVAPAYTRVRAGDVVATIEDVFANEPAQRENQLLQAQILSIQDVRAPISIHAEDAQYLNDQLRDLAVEHAYRLSEDPDFVRVFYDVAGEQLDLRNRLLLSENMGSVSDHVQALAQNTQFIASNQHTIRSNSGGIVAHGVDGLEYLTAEGVRDLSPDFLAYIDALHPNDSGVFRVVSSNVWHIASFFEPYQVAHLSRGQNTHLYLDTYDEVLGHTFRSVLANVSYMEQRDQQVLLVFSMRDFMMDYINQRLIQFRLEAGDLSGMAVPNDAIATRTLMVIPEDFVTIDEDNNHFVTRMTVTETGEEVGIESRINPVISRNQFELTDVLLVVQDFNDLSLGTVLIDVTGGRYTLGRVVADMGVFRVNNGVATFVSIDPTHQLVLEDYTLLSLPENRGGLVVHDRIVANTRDYLIYAGRLIQ